jgi:hypothetical protein
MPQAGRTAAQRQSSNGARVFRVDDDGPTRQLTTLRRVGSRRQMWPTLSSTSFRLIEFPKGIVVKAADTLGHSVRYSYDDGRLTRVLTSDRKV